MEVAFHLRVKLAIEVTGTPHMVVSVRNPSGADIARNQQIVAHVGIHA